LRISHWTNIMGNNRPPFEPDTVFHIYNHGNAEDNIFREKENYYYFLKRYAHYINPVARTYAFCLLPNHFHLMVMIRTVGELFKYFREQGKDLAGFENLPGLVSKQFSNLLNGYLKAFNKKYDRRGKLFLNNLERKPINNSTYFTRLIYYIHHNPVHHGFVDDLADWPFSSYQIILSRKQTQLDRVKVLEWFRDKEEFQKYHQEIHPIDSEEFY
jgi:putative transposase